MSNYNQNITQTNSQPESNSSNTEFNLPNRPPPQPIPNTPFVLYPAASKDADITQNDEKKEENVIVNDSRNNNNNNNNNNRIVEIDFEASNKLIEDSNEKNFVPQLTNDLNTVIFEIDQIHNRIFHLRRTNKEIKEFYFNDIDCKTAYEENILTINKFLKNIFIYFQLFKDLTKGQRHKYEKLYESDKKVIEKYQNMNKKSVEYMMPVMPQTKENNINGASVSENNTTNTSSSTTNTTTKTTVNNNNNNKNENNDDNGMNIDDDGGLTL